MQPAPAAAPAESPPITRMLAEKVSAIRFEELPPEVVFLARQCLLDWMGVTLGGFNEPLAGILRADALEQGGHPQATLIGSGERVTTAQAALVNGAASHALDFDDVHLGMSGHPSVPVIPGLLALAEQRRATGRDFVAAFVAGFEMECRVGALVMPGHYQAGFHATGTLGTFGAAAACAHLMQLDADQWRNALGIAGAQAAGLKSMFGTMCKPFHAGKAAANGLLAASLAARGFTSNADVLETAQGFGATQTGTLSPERALRGLGEDYAIRGTLFKYHAACYGTHETIEGVLRLREENGLDAAKVDAVDLLVPPGHLAMCNIPEPATALEGKFSLRFTAALALAGRGSSEAAFTDEAVHDPALVALRDRVTVRPRSEEQGVAIGGGTDVTVRLRDGGELRKRVNLDIPASDLGQQWRRLVEKYRSLAEPAIGPVRASALLSAIEGLEGADSMAAVAELATAGPARSAP
ncbi:MAG: MmgE/PrpD family protein [Chloroflexi bacterium CFX7]|nr:MmgE/PrpD family protein [Chloroflexi bacterium CFX7]